MKVMFAESRYKGKILLKGINKLPNKIGLVTTIQFIDFVESMKKEIEKTGKEVLVSKGKQKYKGQVLGCESSAALTLDVDAYFYVGTGKFHPINIAMQTQKEVFTFNPLSRQFGKVDKKEITKIQNRKNGAMMKFLTSDSIGILVTTKPGQCDFEGAMKLKKQLEKKEKKVYVFIDNTIDFNSLENFPFIQAWVNTACPRIVEDISIVNLRDVPTQ